MAPVCCGVLVFLDLRWICGASVFWSANLLLDFGVNWDRQCELECYLCSRVLVDFKLMLLPQSRWEHQSIYFDLYDVVMIWGVAGDPPGRPEYFVLVRKKQVIGGPVLLAAVLVAGSW